MPAQNPALLAAQAAARAVTGGAVSADSAHTAQATAKRPADDSKGGWALFFLRLFLFLTLTFLLLADKASLQQEENVTISGTSQRLLIMQKLARSDKVFVGEPGAADIFLTLTSRFLSSRPPP